MKMNRWEILGAAFFGAIFALFFFLRIDAVDSTAARGGVVVFLIGFYWAIVVIGNDEKKRSLSLSGQTLLGVVFACAIAAVLAAPPVGYLVAVLLGLVIGFTVDMWIHKLPLS